jgi:hypothetical protein
MNSTRLRVGLKSFCVLSAFTLIHSISAAQNPEPYGPYNAVFLQDGTGLIKQLHDHDPLATAQRSWSITLWLKTNEAAPTALVAGIGHPNDPTPRYLGLRDGHPVAWVGGQPVGTSEISSKTTLTPGIWHALALSVDSAGISHLIADGTEVASGRLPLGRTSSVVELAPTSAPPLAGFNHFGGWLALVTLRNRALDSADANGMNTPLPGLDNLPFEPGSKPASVQTHAALVLSPR